MLAFSATWIWCSSRREGDWPEALRVTRIETASIRFVEEQEAISARDQCEAIVLVVPTLRNPKPLLLRGEFPNTLPGSRLPRVRPDTFEASQASGTLRKCEGRRGHRAVERYTQAAALKIRCRVASISAGGKSE